METLNLVKQGERVNLSKEAPNTQKFAVGLGWDANTSGSGSNYDLDAIAVVLDAQGKTLTQKHLVYFNNKNTPNGSVMHSGDNLTGAGDGDDETILIDLSKMEAEAQEVLIFVNIYDAVNRRQNFGKVHNSYMRIYDQAVPNTNIVKYELDEDFSSQTCVTFGRIYRKDGEWRFAAVGEGSIMSIKDIVDKYVR